MLRVKANESSKQLISMYTCSGVLMSRFEWNTQMKGIIAHMSWSNEENLVVVSEYVFARIFVVNICIIV